MAIFQQLQGYLVRLFKYFLLLFILKKFNIHHFNVRTNCTTDLANLAGLGPIILIVAQDENGLLFFKDVG